jgi:hypothetical protein
MQIQICKSYNYIMQMQILLITAPAFSLRSIVSGYSKKTNKYVLCVYIFLSRLENCNIERWGGAVSL